MTYSNHSCIVLFVAGAIHSLQGHVCFSGELSMSFLQSPDALKRTVQNCFLLTEEGPNKKVHIQWCRLNGVLRMNPVDSAAIPRPPSAKARQNGTIEGIHEYFFVFTGFHLEQQVLKDWIKTCCKLVCFKRKCSLSYWLPSAEKLTPCTNFEIITFHNNLQTHQDMKRNTLQSVGSIGRAPYIWHSQDKIRIMLETKRNQRLARNLILGVVLWRLTNTAIVLARLQRWGLLNDHHSVGNVCTRLR